MRKIIICFVNIVYHLHFIIIIYNLKNQYKPILLTILKINMLIKSTLYFRNNVNFINY
nr:MAG TPA: hypothetical protein [Caudoviricetes sp.]